MTRRREVGIIESCILGAALAVCLALPAQAGDKKLNLSANVALTTDYVFRGISQTLNDPAVQGGFDATYGLFYAGVWGSNVDFGAGSPADLELDWYGGIRPTWKSLNFDVGVIYYNYPSASGLDILEVKGGVSTTLFQKLGVAATTYYGDPGYWVFEFGAGYSFNKVWMFTPTVSALIGFQDSHTIGFSDYTYWNAGITLGFWDKPAFSIDVRYWDTDNGAACFQFCDSRAVATLKAVF